MPDPCLVVLVGPAGSKKSTWVAQWFEPSAIVSWDDMRAMVGRHRHDLRVSADALEVVTLVVTKRPASRLSTVIDSTALDRANRDRSRALVRASAPTAARVHGEAGLVRRRERSEPLARRHETDTVRFDHVRRRVIPVIAASAGALVVGGLWVRRVVLPGRPESTPTARPHRVPDPQRRPSPDGAGVTIAVNPESGPAWTADPTDELQAALPAARVHRLGEGDDVVAILTAGDPIGIGAAGGDGTLSAAAAVALERDVVLVAIPAGTFNHLARDLGLDEPDDAIEAVRAGTATRIDIGQVEMGGARRTFVNTLSFGGYSQVVDARERLEPRLGKWLGLVVALITELHRMEPLELEVDGRRSTVWLAWIGNCTYAPNGFGPSWRERLDDGRLDVRLVLGGPRLARTRFVLDLLSGRLQRSPHYREEVVESLDVRSLAGPLRLAIDGETVDGGTHLQVSKLRRALLVAVPPGDAT